jgi:hypothetical protein
MENTHETPKEKEGILLGKDAMSEKTKTLNAKLH